MKILVYTLTRDRLEYTKRSFASLQEQDIDFAHVVVDNGSQDGTVEWIRGHYLPQHEASAVRQAALIQLEANYGISVGSNIALEMVAKAGYDVIVKFDNDAMFKETDVLRKLCEVVHSEDEPLRPGMLLSPRVIGINKQPHRARVEGVKGYQLGLTAIVGGLCHAMKAETYLKYRYPEDLPLAKGQDDHICHWFKRQGGVVGYLEELKVHHIDGTNGQAEKFPEYFERKWREEVEIRTSEKPVA